MYISVQMTLLLLSSYGLSRRLSNPPGIVSTLCVKFQPELYTEHQAGTITWNP
jgi:hypothetical protein